MARDVDNLTPVTSRDELVAWIAQGECAPDAVALGTEHEKILYRLADHAPVIYDPPDGRGIRAVLQRLEAATGWTLNQALTALTILYVAAQLGYLLWKWRHERAERNAKRDAYGAEP